MTKADKALLVFTKHQMIDVGFKDKYARFLQLSQEYSRSFSEVICFFPGVPFWTEGFKKVYTTRP